MNRIVTDKTVALAFDWLDENAGPAAAAKAARITAEHAVKRVKSEEFLKAGGTVAEREAQAIASQAYAHACTHEAEAVEKDEWFRYQRGRAEALIEAWRTESSNLRGMGRVA